MGTLGARGANHAQDRKEFREGVPPLLPEVAQ